jgi:uncharacterized membrane protein
LLGTGAGIAFFMVRAHRTGSAATIAQTAGDVITADMLFTATAVVLQPITGALLVLMAGCDWRAPRLVLALSLYGVAGVFWLPVLWLQARMRNLARDAAATKAPLPPPYYRLYRIWCAFGFPAFGSVVAIFWLMTAKPVLF